MEGILDPRNTTGVTTLAKAIKSMRVVISDVQMPSVEESIRSGGYQM